MSTYSRGQRMFLNYGAFLDKFYKVQQTGIVNKNHMFWATRDNPTVLHTKEYRDSVEHPEQEMEKGKASHEVRKNKMGNYQFEKLQPPGLKEIKMVELYKKWRSFMPEEFQDIICPKPPDDVLSRIKRVRKMKKQRKKKSKRNNRLHQHKLLNSVLHSQLIYIVFVLYTTTSSGC